MKVLCYVSGRYRTFSSINDNWGCDILPSAEIQAVDDGFMRDDFFLIRLDMRLKQEDSEIFQMTVNDNTAMFHVFPIYVQRLGLTV